MTHPALWIAAALGVLGLLAVWAGRRLERSRLAMERDEAEREAWEIEAARREADEREARVDARWAALLRAIHARRSAGFTDADAHHALTLDAVRRRVLGTDRRDGWAA